MLKVSAPIAIGLVCLLTGCDLSSGGAPSAEPSGQPATCDGVGAEYGDGFADELIKQGASPSVKAGVRKAVVTACKEDKWDDLTLGCMGVASKAKARHGRDTLDACVSGLPAELQAKMERRVQGALH
ncbi:MAG: hypothetical protein HOV80_11660 [Polyangiaceae bacterium]|nr:hypothetical protein [Polyangiaceae bacterium]